MTSKLIALIIYFLFFLFSLVKSGTLTSDESIYHFPNLINFYQNGFHAIFNSQYSSANTPLPYFIVSIVAKLTAPTLFIARITTLIVSLLAFFVVTKLLDPYGVPVQLSLVILFFPYCFVNSFVFYVMNYGLFFALLALLFLRDAEQKNSFGSYFTVGLLSTLAALCQQFYLVIPLAIVFSRLVLSITQNAGKLLFTLKKTTSSNLAILIPLIVPFILFIKWGGLTHPNFRMHSIAFYPSTVIGILFVTGFYLLPFSIQSLRGISKLKVLSFLFVSTLLVFFFRPIFSNIQGPRIFTGLVHHLIALIGWTHPLLATLIMILLVCSGILVLKELFCSLTLQWELVCFTICICLGCTYSFNTLIGERHLLGYLVVLLLLALPRIRKPMAIIFPVFMALLGISYFFYVIFIKYPN